MQKRLQAFILIAAYLVISCLTSCASDNDYNKPIENRSKSKAIFEKGTTRVYRRSGNYGMHTPESVTATVTPVVSRLSREERSQKIAEAVTELDAIFSASAVITGNTAIVGVRTDSRYNDSELIDIKRMVEERVKAVDKGIDHVSVTTSEDLTERINRMPDAGSCEDVLEEWHDDFLPRG